MRADRIARRGKLKKKILAAKKVIDFQASVIRELNQRAFEQQQETHVQNHGAASTPA